MNAKDLPTVTARDLLILVQRNLADLAPMDATEYLQELIHELAYYSLGITRVVIAPMTRAGNTEMLLATPKAKSEIILPKEKKIVLGV